MPTIQSARDLLSLENGDSRLEVCTLLAAGNLHLTSFHYYCSLQLQAFHASLAGGQN